MSLQEDRYKAMLFDYPEYIPVRVGMLPAVWMKYREQVNELAGEYPLLFDEEQRGKEDYDVIDGMFVEGEHVDAWGCVWSNVNPGMYAIVTGHPLPNRSDVRTLKMPEDDEGFPHGFMYLRLADLRGFEEVMIDFAEEPPELQMLIDLVLGYNLRQADIRLDSFSEASQIVYFGDDLGMQRSLPIDPRKWRRYLKPCFRKIFTPFVEAGHYIYLHSDGHMLEIVPDLLECGVSVINPQIGANGLDNVVETCKGRVCVDLDLDRQLFPFASSAQLEEHVHEAVEKLGSREGGLWLIAQIDQGVPLENIDAICGALMKYRGYFRHTHSRNNTAVEQPGGR